jgi:hypothetical protein
MAEDIMELKENAEHGSEGSLAPVTMTMAILAVLVASVTLLGHRAHTSYFWMNSPFSRCRMRDTSPT